MQSPALFAPQPTADSTLADVGLLDLIADSVICTDGDGHILVFNRAAERTFGYSASEVLGERVEVLLPERSRAEHAEQVRRFASENGAADRIMGHSREVTGRRKDGEEFPAEATVSRQVVQGQTILTVVHRDISERKQLEAERELVARELDHRVRNLLSVVASIVRLSATDVATVEDFKQSLLDRLGALARTQAALKPSIQQSASLTDVFLAELDHYRARDAAVCALEGPAIALNARAAQALALIFHELAANSAKYGALKAVGGRIAVTWSLEDQGQDRLVVVEWCEHGGPRAEEPKQLGFGTTLIRKVIASLKGQAALSYAADGLTCRMTLPLAAIAAEHRRGSLEPR